MSDLDEKLKTVLDDAFATEPNGEVWLVEPVIERIKQAFIGAGWRQGQGPYYDAMVDAIKKEAGLMTGQEWYDRFINEREIRTLRASELMTAECKSVLQAAKKASGLL